MTRRISAVALALALVACSKAKSSDHQTGSATTPTPSGSAAPAASDAPAAPPAIDAATAMEGSGSATPGTGSGSGSSAVAADFDFDKLSHDDKVKFMKQKVMPEMKPAFQKFDAKEYANFGCKTCHGKDPQKTKYKMPNPDLKPLDFVAIKAGKEDPKYVEFMQKTVKPGMAKILNQPEMTATSDGFGCLDCHTTKKK